MKRVLVFLAAVALLAPLRAFADGPSAREIVKAASDKGAANLLDLKAEITLVTTDKAGAAKTRKMSMASKKIGGKVSSLVRFRAPPDVAGIALLAVEGGAGKADELTLYLPAFKRTRRVAQGQRGSSFADTDFSYADFSRGGGSVNEDAGKRLPDEKLLEREVYVVEGPAETGSPYATVRGFFEKKTFLPLRIEMLDKDGSKLKTYSVKKLTEVSGRTLAGEAVMENHKTGSATSITLDKVEVGAPPDELFTERGLERG